MRKTARAIAQKEVEHAASLARIELSEREKKLFTEQLSTILEYFKVIDEVKTEGVPPTFHILDLTNVLREDEVEPSLPRDEALKNASVKVSF